MNTCANTFIENTSPLRILLAIVLFTTLTRIAIPPFIGHPPNFSALDATALFCGAYFNRRFLAVMTVWFSVGMGDLFLNKIFFGHWTLFYSGFYWQYASYFLITLIGMSLKNNIKPMRLFSSCILSATLFFLISNFGVWFGGLLYPLTLNGLITCYIAAIPFFKNSLFSDLFFTIVLFGCFALVKMKSSQYMIKNKTE